MLYVLNSSELTILQRVLAVVEGRLPNVMACKEDTIVNNFHQKLNCIFPHKSLKFRDNCDFTRKSKTVLVTGSYILRRAKKRILEVTVLCRKSTIISTAIAEFALIRRS